MTDKPKKPARWDEFKTWLLDDLTDDERLYVKAWVSKFVTKFGQVPQAASQRASAAYTKRPPCRAEP